MADMHTEYKNHILYLAAVLASWRHDEGLEIYEMAEETGIDDRRIQLALLGEDWEPSLQEIAQLEVALDAEVYITISSDD